jgi:hypothetical protein
MLLLVRELCFAQLLLLLNAVGVICLVDVFLTQQNDLVD